MLKYINDFNDCTKQQRRDVMKRSTFILTLALLVFALGCSTHYAKTKIIDDLDQMAFSFEPGNDCVECELYDAEKNLIEVLQVQPGKRYHNPHVWFIKCRQSNGKEVWPKYSVAPICPFTGPVPKCHEWSGKGIIEVKTHQHP